MLRVAVVGAGGWGKNLVRTFHACSGAQLTYICDLDRDRLDGLAGQYPGTAVTMDYDMVLGDDSVEAIAIATPATTHFELGRRALVAGKHVYIEKPFVLQSEDARALMDLAGARNRVLMVGHLMKYHPVTQHLREMIQANELGQIRYVYSQRLNLGTVRGDENALWNFAPHDISMILYLLNETPSDVSARGQSYLQSGVEDVVFLNLNFNDEAMAHIHVSWLDPSKVRRTTVVGSQKMAVFDDLESNEKLRVYDKGADVKVDYNSFAEYVGLRFGDITVPYIKLTEPLRVECNHYLDCIRNGTRPLSDGFDGLRVVEVLTAAEQSLKCNGRPIALR